MNIKKSSIFAIIFFIIFINVAQAEPPSNKTGGTFKGGGTLESDLDPMGAANRDMTSTFRYAAGYNPTIMTDDGIKDISISIIIYQAISVFLSLLGVIFIILIIYAGYTWMTAQGDEQKVTKAKQTIQRSVIGLAIIIMAYSITYFVFRAIPYGEETPGIFGAFD